MNQSAPSSGSDVVIFEAPNGDVRPDVRLDADMVWLTQQQLAELLETPTGNVGPHLKNIYADEEIAEAATTEEISVVRVILNLLGDDGA